MKYAAHAVALNEHRGGIMNFHLRSILDAPATSSGGNRNEMGFVGSHSDIGGSYGTGDLSNVALMWMIEQGKLQGIRFNEGRIGDEAWNVDHQSHHPRQERQQDRPYRGSGVRRPLRHLRQRYEVEAAKRADWRQRHRLGEELRQLLRGVVRAGRFTGRRRRRHGAYGEWLKGQGVNVTFARLNRAPLQLTK